MRNPRALGKRPYILTPICKSVRKQTDRLAESKRACEWERGCGCPNARQDSV